MAKTKQNHILTAMRNHKIIFFIVVLMVIFGIFSLTKINKDEFPQFTIRQGVVAAIYPGATAQEIEEQVTIPLERFLFTYPEIDKKKTYSISENGAVYIYAELRNNITNKDEVWSKIRHGLQLFKKTALPAGVLEIVVIDDFGNTASLLLSVEAENRSPRELTEYAQLLCNKLRTINAMGNIKLHGEQHEEIAIYIDADKITQYAINQQTLLATLATQGFRTISGNISNEEGESLVHITTPYQTEYEIGEQIILTDPTGKYVRLKDIATLERRYKEAKNYIEHEGKPSILISVEMTPGNNIVAFGKEVDLAIQEIEKTLPPDIHFHKITNQPKVVAESVYSFLRDLVFSILVVIIVMMILFPFRTALVASSGVPICTAIAIGFMYLFNIEINTVTLAALIVVLGMIVDDSVIIIDGYIDELHKGHSRWYSATESTKQLFLPMSLATIAISGMFFPMTKIITGPLGEFVQLFPWTIAFALIASIFYATWVIPYLSTQFIHHSNSKKQPNAFERIQNRFFSKLQLYYEKCLEYCFRYPKITLTMALVAIGIGVFLFLNLNIQMLPKADRNCFAVEIYLPQGSPLNQTADIAHEMAQILHQDARVTSITSFIGCSSPRFHATYAPQMARTNYAQFIVNTTDEVATRNIIQEYSSRYENLSTKAHIRFKQIDYQAVKNPIEIHIAGTDLEELNPIAEEMKQFLNSFPDATWVHSDFDESCMNIEVNLKEEEATRFGITQSMLSLQLSSILNGQNLTSLWEKDYKIPINLYTIQSEEYTNYQSLGNHLISTAIPQVWVPLRQIAEIKPSWGPAQISHRNNIRTITVSCDLKSEKELPQIMKSIKNHIETHYPSEKYPNIDIQYGGLTGANQSVIPEISLSILAALFVLFIFLLYHFAKIKLVLLTISASALCIFGSCVGLKLFGLNFSITATLGIVSLIGIIVRNAIIMFEHAEQLHNNQHLTAREAALMAGKRRMRPIFLTSATTALGVLPMIIAHTALWMPMGVVICFGTLLTLPLVTTILPVAYWKINEK